VRIAWVKTLHGDGDIRDGDTTIARILLAVVLAIGLLGAPRVACTQPAANVPRIGWLSIASRTPEVAHLIEAFELGLRELGYLEGQTIAIEYRFADGRPERLPGLAAELIGRKVDIIVAPNPAGAQAAKQATRTVPIVMLAVVDPVGTGLVASLARPGGNITGLAATSSPEIVGKYLELLKQAVPKVSRVAVLRNPANPDTAQMSREVERAARSLGVQLQVLDVTGPHELDGAFAAMTRDRAGALLVLADTMFFLHRTLIASLATKNRLPTISGNKEMAEAGLLMTYGRNLTHDFRRAAVYVDKILKGAKPADLPVELATKFELVINLKTAKALGLTIPPSVLARADALIQ
jgi:putative ABC transport system substrate-binding protein